MEKKMFGHRAPKRRDMGRTPGQPYNTMDYERGDEDEESYSYVKSKDNLKKGEAGSYGNSKDAPPGYEGKEHVKYRDPGHSPHHIRYPEDEPHMKSHVSSDEEHEMEDNYHMDVPDQTNYDLAAKIKRARMKMDSPDYDAPKRLRGNLVEKTGERGMEAMGSGEEDMGPNDMQSNSMPKEHRKKMIVAVMKRKMKK